MNITFPKNVTPGETFTLVFNGGEKVTVLSIDIGVANEHGSGYFLADHKQATVQAGKVATLDVRCPTPGEIMLYPAIKIANAVLVLHITEMEGLASRPSKFAIPITTSR